LGRKDDEKVLRCLGEQSLGEKKAKTLIKVGETTPTRKIVLARKSGTEGHFLIEGGGGSMAGRNDESQEKT